MQFFRGVGQSGAGLMPRARWLFGCNKIAAYKTQFPMDLDAAYNLGRRLVEETR